MEEIAIEPQRGLNFKQVWTALKKSSADFDRCMQETDKEIKALSKNIGGLNKSPGKLIEQMFSAQLWEKFDALGYEFTQGGNRKFIENKQIIEEVDIFLENGEYVVPVEVKVHLKKEDVDEWIELIRGYMDRRGDKRGLYVLKQSGELVIIAKAPDGFTARLW